MTTAKKPEASLSRLFFFFLYKILGARDTGDLHGRRSELNKEQRVKDDSRTECNLEASSKRCNNNSAQ